MLSLRYLLRLAIAFLKRFKGILAISIILGIFMFFVLRALVPVIFGKPAETIGLVGRFSPDSLPTPILNLISDGLTRVDSGGGISPGLAETWQASDDGKTWTFKLKDGLFWQDGKKVDSSGIVYQFSDAKIERPDKQTLVFRLKSPFAPFPFVVSQPTFKKGLLGTGEWRVTKASLVGNFVQKLVLENKNKDKRIYKFYPTEERVKLAFKLGQVDKISDITSPLPFDNWKTAKIESATNYSGFVAVFLNTEDKLLSEKTVRQAMAYAVDKAVFPYPRALGPISPQSWAYNPQVKQYNYDPERAKDLLRDLPKELKDSLNVKLVTIPVLLNTAETIAKYWRAIGLNVTLQVTSGMPNEYQALLAIYNTPKDPDQYAIWHSTQEGSNISKYKNPRIDKLLEDGRQELNFEARKKIYLDFQRFLIEDSPAIFLYHPNFFSVARK